MQGQTSTGTSTEKRQRRLRHEATDAERKPWQYLRTRQVEGCKFRRQHPFGDFILDFVCLERKLIVELDGGQHADSIGYDRARTRFLEQSGFAVLRFWNNNVFENVEGVLEVIADTLRRTGSPSPPLEGEGQ